MKTNPLITSLLLFLLATSSIFCQEIIPLYEGKIPNRLEKEAKEIQEEDGILKISNVQKPTLEAYYPAKRYANGKAVIICPGGGYHILAYDWEGTDIAKWYNSKGYAAFVLKYRLPIANTVINKNEVPLQDAKRAIQIVRKNAVAWGLKEDGIGVMGFSAGGHLASTLGTHFNQDTKIPNDPYKDISARPDFMVLVYPVITMKDSSTHSGSKNALLGENPSEELIKRYSNELQVTPDTPPTFLVHSQDDIGVSVENSLLFYKALKEKNVPSEMHLYPKGGHGFGLALSNDHLKTWPDRLFEWLEFLEVENQ
ncbi:alpha/beta hydrolase [Galbibacter sp. BG1]|uniref:alpha/beta hydrolase n=1 Tax=Galbibacter sp. BG1 TaxID=1170699 RepID=UPI0015BE8D9D|nr:alpha/beta hydrolase [Galbibacter sp. BG1]QLE02301.1 alpha/beta hydrolase [Galbibacter sp. BG1]